jgi:hypothetical protein
MVFFFSDGVVNALDIDVFRNLCLQMKNPNVDSHAFKTFSEFLEIWLKTIKDSSDTLNEDVSLEVCNLKILQQGDC